MKKLLNLTLALGLALVLTSTVAQANNITLGFKPPAQTVPIGTPVSVEVEISGLGAFSAPSLGSFVFDVNFDPSIVGYTGATFGDPVNGDQLDILGFGSPSAATPAVGSVNLFEVSFDFDVILDAAQLPAFTLVTLNFDTLNVGTSPLTISNAILGDSQGNSLEDANTVITTAGSITVAPEPGTWVLMLSGLTGMIGILRKRAAAQV